MDNSLNSRLSQGPGRGVKCRTTWDHLLVCYSTVIGSILARNDSELPIFKFNFSIGCRLDRNGLGRCRNRRSRNLCWLGDTRRKERKRKNTQKKRGSSNNTARIIEQHLNTPTCGGAKIHSQTIFVNLNYEIWELFK